MCKLSPPGNTIPGSPEIYGGGDAVGTKAIAVPCGEVGVAVKSGAFATWELRYPEGINFYLRLEQPGFLVSLAPEYNIPAGFGGDGPKVTDYQLYSLDVAKNGKNTGPSKVPASFPDFAANKAHIYLVIDPSSAPAPATPGCTLPLGLFKVRVDGHPEAKIVYWDDKGPNATQTESRTNTTNDTFASISQLVPAFDGELVTVSGENTDGLPAGAGTCKLGQRALTGSDAWATGKIPLVANTITNVRRFSFKK